MLDYRLEWDVTLWTYVLCYNNQRYPLNASEAGQAYSCAQLKLIYLKRIENQNKLENEQ